MNAAEKNGPDASERARLFSEVATLRAQRNELMRKLADCESELARVKAELEKLRRRSD